jgi:hypothetical protein
VVLFERGFVTYSNEAKQAMVGVTSAMLASHGAVSRETAEAMADRIRGVRARGSHTLPDNRWKRVDIKSISLLPNVLAKQAARGNWRPRPN